MSIPDSLLFFDHSGWSQIKITGNDRKSFLHSFCTNDIQSLKPGEICEAFIPDIKGRVLGHVFVLDFEKHLLLLGTAGTNQTIVPHLTKYLLGVDAQVVDQTGQSRILCLIGSQVHNVLGLAEDIYMNRHQITRVNEVEFSVARLDVTSEPTYFLFDSSTDLRPVVVAFNEQGLPISAGVEFERLRISAGFPYVPTDISDTNIAQEAARTERTISFKKGCYLGQEPIARLDAMGHTNKELRGLLIDCGDILPGSEVLAEEKSIGIISSCVSLNPDQSVGLAVIRTAHAKPGNRVAVVTESGTFPATIYWPSLSDASPGVSHSSSDLLD